MLGNPDPAPFESVYAGRSNKENRQTFPDKLGKIEGILVSPSGSPKAAASEISSALPRSAPARLFFGNLPRAAY